MSIKTKSVIVLLFASLISLSLKSQTIYLPTSNEVYDFLKRMESKQLLLDYKDAAKPLSRLQIAKALKSLESKTAQMTQLEKETYAFYETEFNYEFLILAGDSEPTEIRWHIFSKELNEGILNFDINYALNHINREGEITDYRAQGLKMYGYVYKDIGYYFNLVDNRESGNNLNIKRANTPDPGIIPSAIYSSSKIDYDENDAQFTWQLGKFSLSLEKNKNIWGYGENGNVIFSTKAPSYPQIKLRVPLSEDIEFIYFHGELNSNVTDSSRSYWITYPNYTVYRDVDHSKYIAAHQLEISVFKGVDFSLGESVVYSDRGPLLMYLIPIMVFKAGEHYNGDKDNCQLFGSLDLNVIKNVNFYSSLFIDELNTDAILHSYYNSHLQIAFIIGCHTYDALIDNTELTTEYTRTNPAVYNHKYPANTFTNNGFVLGDWMGQNADNIFLQLAYRPIRQLKLSIFNEVYRKGGDLPIADQYSSDQGHIPFLFGPLHVERMYGLKGHYQPLRDVFIDAMAQIHTITDETDPTQNRNKQFEFMLSASLGLW